MISPVCLNGYVEYSRHGGSAAAQDLVDGDGELVSHGNVKC